MFCCGYCEILRADSFVEHLVVASELSVLQKLCFFLSFDTLPFIISFLILMWFTFLWYKQKSVDQFSLYKLMILLTAINFWKSIIDPLLSIFSRVKTIMISVIVGLLVFVYFANEFSTLAVSNDKRHLDTIFIKARFPLGDKWRYLAITFQWYLTIILKTSVIWHHVWLWRERHFIFANIGFI